MIASNRFLSLAINVTYRKITLIIKYLLLIESKILKETLNCVGWERSSVWGREYHLSFHGYACFYYYLGFSLSHFYVFYFYFLIILCSFFFLTFFKKDFAMVYVTLFLLLSLRYVFNFINYFKNMNKLEWVIIP